jgi:hypothetical protein
MSNSPFVGPRPFGKEDSDRFFDRAGEIRRPSVTDHRAPRRAGVCAAGSPLKPAVARVTAIHLVIHVGN